MSFLVPPSRLPDLLGPKIAKMLFFLLSENKILGRGQGGNREATGMSGRSRRRVYNHLFSREVREEIFVFVDVPC